jgi:catechol 2,3-dioxygenase-like lactoylglutathione lyase family enzyme
MKLRIARHTDRLAEVTSFYRDRVGLRQTGGFEDHGGYDGVFLEIPGADAELELTSGGGHAAPAPHPESLLVLYYDDPAELTAAVARIGQEPVQPANPFWRREAIAFADPDGFQVLLVLRGRQ